MNLHMPQDEESEAELKNLAAVPYQIISPANNASIVGVFQDSLLGAYRFTRPNIKFNQREAMNLLMAFNKPNVKIFKKPAERINSFDLLTQILPPLSSHFRNGQYDSTEDPKISNNILKLNIPVLGICYGLQTLALQNGGKIKKSLSPEYGFAKIKIIIGA